MKARKKQYNESDFAKDMAKALGKPKARPKPRINNPRTWLNAIDDDCPPFYDLKRTAFTPKDPAP